MRPNVTYTVVFEHEGVIYKYKFSVPRVHFDERIKAIRKSISRKRKISRDEAISKFIEAEEARIRHLLRK